MKKVVKNKPAYMAKVIERTEVQKAFQKFVERPIPEYINEVYGDDHPFIIAEVFVIEKQAQGLIGSGQASVDELLTYPLAKVLQVGSQWEINKGCKCKAGDILRLKDNDAGSQINPAYEKSLAQNKTTNSANRSGATGTPPPATITNLLLNWARRSFCPDPFQLDYKAWDGMIFFLDTANVLMPVKDPKILYTLPEITNVVTRKM